MAALASLAGLECAACRQKGHRCQAQMWDGDKPVCLRCADGERCCFETGAQLPTPERYVEQCAGIFAVPMSERSTPRTPHRVVHTAPVMSRKERSEIYRQLRTVSPARVARLHGLPLDAVEGMAEDARARLPPLSGNDLAHVEAMRRTPQMQTIAGERVRIAPLASMGAEMLGHNDKRATFRLICKLVAAEFGLGTALAEGRDRRRDVVLARQAVLFLLVRDLGMGVAEAGRFFAMHHTTAMHAVAVIEQKCAANEMLKNNIQALEAALEAALRG